MAISVNKEQREQLDVPVTLVDCDVHPFVTIHDVLEFIEEPWRSRYFRNYPTEVEVATPMYSAPVHSYRQDTRTPSGGQPGEDPAFLEEQHMRGLGVDIALLLVQLVPRTKLGQPELESALCSAVNSWLDATWLSRPHGRYRGSIRVCADDQLGAVAEIERWADHPSIVEVYLQPEATASYGHPQYQPVIEAAVRAGFPIALHVFRTPGVRSMTPVGFPSYHVEIMAQWPMYFMSQLASFIFNGVFDRYPEARFVGLESGIGWITPFFWRLDQYWEALGREATGALRRPSDYLEENIRFTTQPVEEPSDRKALIEMVEWLGAMGGEKVLMFSSDYPHHDYDDPEWVTPRLPKSHRERILAKNAMELYGLPPVRAADEIDLAPESTE